MNVDAYERSLRAVRRAMEREDHIAADDCRTLMYLHGRPTERVTLFFHGMTASPRQFERLALYAHASGDNVLVPRLPKHGYTDRMTGELANMRREDLQRSAERALEIARGLGSHVRVVGFSLGGLIAAWIAQHQVVGQSIAIAPLLGIAGVPNRVTPAFVNALSRLPNAFLWWNPIEKDRLMPAHGYPRFATHAIAESLSMALELSSSARKRAPRSPIVLLTNAGESAVNNRAVTRLAMAWLKHGDAQVRLERMTGLGLSHDVIEPHRDRTKIGKSYPFIYELLRR